MAFLGYMSVFMIACSLLCGLWMKFKPGKKDVNFHAVLSIATLLMCLITIIVYLNKI